jgi:Putative DNA-binding domain
MRSSRRYACRRRWSDINAASLLDRLAEEHAVGNIQQSVTGFDPKMLVGLSGRPRSGRQLNDGVKSHGSRTTLIEILAARYPVICRLVRELSFRIVARRFILSEPPNIAIFPSYGDNFPRFLQGQGNAASFEYVADIAELEMVRGKARCAPDVRPLAAEALLSLRAQWPNGLRITLHPSVCLVQSRFPIVTIWENNQCHDENGMIDRWGAEAALVARPFLEVEVRRLLPGGYTFVRALSEGQTVATAVRAATAATSKFEVASSLALLIDANVIVGIHQAA